jgi:predicted ABC-type ATPase
MSVEKPQVVVIAGPNGAGKTTLAPFLLRDTFGVLEFVNADTISAGLSAFNPEDVALDAGRVMLSRLRELAESRENFAFESTLSTRSYSPWIQSLRLKGYDFHLIFLGLRTVELAIERVAERVRGGGHHVPEQVIRRRYERGLRNLFELYMPFADTWALYDNSGSDFPLLIATGSVGSAQRTVRSDLWENFQEFAQ